MLCAAVKAVEAYLKTSKTIPVNVKARQPCSHRTTSELCWSQHNDTQTQFVCTLCAHSG